MVTEEQMSDEQLSDEREIERGKRKFLRYVTFKVAREWRSLEEGQKTTGREEFLNAIDRHISRMSLRFYSLVGTRGDADFMVWATAKDLSQIQELVSDLLSTGFGKHLDVVHSFLAMSKHSTYLGSHKHAGQEDSADEVNPHDSKYLFVYPLVKKREWYRTPFSERQRIMADHFRIGHRYPRIRINTGYSFGLDDQEFVLAFEGDSPAEFLDLVEELRTSEASRYTERETPLLTGLSFDPHKGLGLFG